MRARTLLLGTAAALSLGGAAQAAPFHGWYVGLEGGADWVQEKDFVVHLPLGTTHHAQLSFKTGWALLASVGYAFDKHWRVEGEFGYRSNNLDKTALIGGPPTAAHGDLRELTVMANVLYDIPLAPKWDLSIGGGIGGDDALLKFNTLSDNTWKFAYQGIAGLNHAIGQRSQVFLDYRFLTDTKPVFSNSAVSLDFNDLHKHTVTIGFRYALQAQEEAAPAPLPPSPPALPPAAPKQFVIFFGFAKCNITSEADAVLSEAASAAKSYGSASVEIVGHTDTVGSVKHNQKLSECRANAAATNLQGKGVPAGAIHTSGVGKSDLLIQTGDGVKEPQNRRDTINLR